MKQSVVIVGGGVAGLTAAHELIERNFDVHLYERRNYYGGKAASVRWGDKRQFPGEHGFRFYPGWYRHLPDTMKRIPYLGKRSFYAGATVLDNLVAVSVDVLTWYDRNPIEVLMHFPRSFDQAKTALSVVGQLRRLGLGPGEVSFFVQRLAEFLATPEPRREERYDQLTWWDFLEADRKSQAFRDLISATTRTMVAAKATEASAYTIGKMAVRTLFDTLSTVDRVLNGPTNEVWIDPWVSYLQSRGVQFHGGQELDSIQFTEQTKKVESLRFSSVLSQNIGRLTWQMEELAQWASAMEALCERQPLTAEERQLQTEMCGHIESGAEQLAEVIEALVDQFYPADPAAPGVKMAAEAVGLAHEVRIAAKEVKTAARMVQNGSGVVELERARKALSDAGARTVAVLAAMEAEGQGATSGREVRGDFFIFALPLEQMAYYVNRSTMMTHHDPSLRQIVLLAEHVDWMAGIQFFLQEPVDLGPGHIVCMDAEWGLTAIEEMQYWRDVQLPEDVKAIISVDIAAWDRKGRFTRKEAFNCTDDEIAMEVWSELTSSVNRDIRSKQLRNEMLRSWDPKLQFQKRVNYYLDTSVVDLLDRKKQAFYEKARSVRFSANELLERQQKSGHEIDTPYIWGRRLRFNVEPLLVNRVGAHRLRPEARTGIPNMFLASDYVRTHTDLACMEGANEAARHAVNGVLEAAGSSERRCDIWKFSIPADLMERLFGFARMGEGIGGTVGQVANAFFGAASRASDEVLGKWRKSNG
jgi:uncharacterized protein with NAD-binding domain and iron-sulfur cluster